MPPAGSSRAVMAAPASDRRVSSRQSRTTVTRPTNYYARSFAGRLAAMGGMEQTPPATNNTPGFLPALTHFTDAVDAFPKELIKHFSMFKEVEAKIHDPDNVLQLLLDEIAKQPIPTVSERHPAFQTQTDNNSVNGSVNGSIMQDSMSRHQQLSVELFPADFQNLPPEEQADLRRRQLFFRLRMAIAAMLPTLDEKLVVLSAAKATKDKGLTRMNSSYPHIDNEISEEARFGSLAHWAYADKEEKKKGERTRREVVSANNLAAAAQLVHDADTIAAKSEARREAMMANKRSRNHHVDSDFDDSRPAKKQTKARKVAAEAPANSDKVYGLGISGHGAPQGRKRKTEKAVAPPLERSLSSALKNANAGGRSGISPRATPGAENGKGKARPAPAQATGRKRGAIAHSPAPASSPLVGTFSVTKEVTATVQRPTSTRMRKNSIANSVASGAQEAPPGRRPSSAHSNRPANSSNAITELEQAAGITRDNGSNKGDSTPKVPSETNGTVETSTLKHEETEVQEAEPMDIEPPAPAPVTTRAGRASKTATPIVGTFPEIPMVRQRSTRNANNGGKDSHDSSETSSQRATTKRSHKKGAFAAPAAAAVPPLEPDDEGSSPPAELSDGVDEDGDEPRYCYCNEVSYGNMIACDNDECPREWFHLACVNMEKAPNARTKWYCSDTCREIATRAKEKKSRPGSRQ